MEPIVKEVVVGCSPEHAFDTWTERIGRWWPTADYSRLGPTSRNVTIEPGVGGRVFEDDGAGRTALWGTVTVWEPTTRFAHTFTPWAGIETRVEVSFTAVDDGCRVRLVHDGWTEASAERRPGYDTGWEDVMGHFAKATG